MSSHATQKTLARVEAYCQKHGSRFTAQRKAVLEVISDSATPLGAYDILERLRTVLNNPKPPTIYRAISFLEEHHFIHRIESLNAYVICDTDHLHSGAQFLICDSCSKVTE
ncbi:MAG: transcriptional repressor, partial [Pseudomonadota bacterium]